MNIFSNDDRNIGDFEGKEVRKFGFLDRPEREIWRNNVFDFDFLKSDNQESQGGITESQYRNQIEGWWCEWHNFFNTSIGRSISDKISKDVATQSISTNTDVSAGIRKINIPKPSMSDASTQINFKNVEEIYQNWDSFNIMDLEKRIDLSIQKSSKERFGKLQDRGNLLNYLYSFFLT